MGYFYKNYAFSSTFVGQVRQSVLLPASLLQLALTKLASSAFTQTEEATSMTDHPRLHCLVDLPSSALGHWTRPQQKSPAALLVINAWYNMEE